MQQEVEVKFLDVDHDTVREKLQALGAELEHPMRLMRRTVFDYPDRRLEANHARLRVRDEGDRITVTYKARVSTSEYADETETTVGSYDTMCELLKAIGLDAYSVQESKRETWKYKDVEVVLDVWPWLKPYIEIEGPNEAAIKAVAEDLGFDWANAKFGSPETAYREEYPGLKDGETIGEMPVIAFNMEKPEWLVQRTAA